MGGGGQQGTDYDNKAHGGGRGQRQGDKALPVQYEPLQRPPHGDSTGLWEMRGSGPDTQHAAG